MAKKQKDKQKNDKPVDRRVSILVNKKARHNFEILQEVEAGIALVGAEVKSLREGRVNVDEAFGRIYGQEVFLVGCHIATYSHGSMWTPDPLRKRKLLLRKREILKLKAKVTQRGLTLVPLDLYFTSRGLAKVTLGLCRGKKKGDKREDQKSKEAKKEMRDAM